MGKLLHFPAPDRVASLCEQYRFGPDAIGVEFIGDEGAVEVWWSLEQARAHRDALTEAIADCESVTVRGRGGAL